MTSAATNEDNVRFSSLWQRLCPTASRSSSAAVWQLIATLYSEPHRHYHNLNHIRHCLRQLDKAPNLQQNQRDTLEIALWFHDLVHNDRDQHLEAKSALRFREHCPASMNPEVADKVVELIMTTTHTERQNELLNQYMVDIDLSGFGGEWALFAKDSDNLRLEQPHMSDAQYYADNRDFLESLLARPSVFASDYFRAELELRARENIQRFLNLADQNRR